jgi:hypothetical protein
MDVARQTEPANVAEVFEITGWVVAKWMQQKMNPGVTFREVNINNEDF